MLCGVKGTRIINAWKVFGYNSCIWLSQNIVHLFLQVHLEAMKMNEIQAALEIVEKERAKLTSTEAIPTEDIMTMGAAEYVMNHLTESMRHKAHKCVTAEMKHGNENVYRVNSTDGLDVNHRLNDRIDHVDQIEKDNTMKLEDLTLGQSQIVSELDGSTGSAEKENVDHAQGPSPRPRHMSSLQSGLASVLQGPRLHQ